MKLNLTIGTLLFCLWFAFYGCGSSGGGGSYDNGIPFPSSSVVFNLDDLSGPISARTAVFATDEGYTREGGLARNAYLQAGIDLDYFEGFDPVMSTFRSETLVALSSNESTFEGTYGGDIRYKGLVVTSESNYIVKVWGIRPGDSGYSRWVYGDFINSSKGTLIVNPYVMWTSTHAYPMAIRFEYDAATAGTKVCTGGATGRWDSTTSIEGSTYFYCLEDNSDPSNTIVTFQMYSRDNVIGLDMLYGKFNRDERRLHGREWCAGYATPDSGLLYVNTATFTTAEGSVPANIDASAMTWAVTPEASYADFPAASEFPLAPTF
jgi:hypothetical protein